MARHGGVATADSVTRALDSFVARGAEISEAIIVSPEALPLAASAGLSSAAADRFAAVAAGLFGLARGASERFDAGSVTEVIVEFDSVHLLVSGVVEESVLAVVCSGEDLAAVGYEMTKLGGLLDELLDPDMRSTLQLMFHERTR